MEKIKIEITCPKCEKEFKQRIENMRPGKSKKCPHCLTNIDFSGDDFSKAQKMLDNFEKEINKTLNTLNFK